MALFGNLVLLLCAIGARFHFLVAKADQVLRRPKYLYSMFCCFAYTYLSRNPHHSFQSSSNTNSNAMPSRNAPTCSPNRWNYRLYPCPSSVFCCAQVLSRSVASWLQMKPCKAQRKQSVHWCITAEHLVFWFQMRLRCWSLQLEDTECYNPAN